LRTRRLGTSALEVSVLALGSWRTFERIPRSQALEVMQTAFDVGISFLDDARYNDETGSAPLASGYSEVLFGELFRATGRARESVVLANKLWWEFWPEQRALDELDGSLARTGLDYLDLEYALPPPDGLEIADVVRELAGLIDSGKLLAWGVANWTPQQIEQAVRVARAEGLPLPCAAQLPYSLVNRGVVEDPVMVAALGGAEIPVVASATLAYGALSGKYESAAEGRIADEVHGDAYGPARAAAASLRELGARLGVASATLAYGFALANPAVASVLFGATRAAQVAENAAAADVVDRLTAAELAELRAIGLG
jgi:aryl-alcohol dehydrogenase-like predicted oxidoreductase